MAIQYSRPMPTPPRGPKKAYDVEQGRLIRKAREALDLTQEQLAQKVGIKQPSIAFIENGRRGASRETLSLIAKALGLSLDELEPRGAPMSPRGRGADLPPGLEHFLSAYSEREKITAHERWQLEGVRFRAEPWVTYDDEFWLEQLRFWRQFYSKRNRP